MLLETPFSWVHKAIKNQHTKHNYYHSKVNAKYNTELLMK